MYNGHFNNQSGGSSQSNSHHVSNPPVSAELRAHILQQQQHLDEQQRLIDQQQARLARERMQLAEIARQQALDAQALQLQAEIAAGEEAKRKLDLLLNQQRNRASNAVVPSTFVDPRQLNTTYEPTPSTSKIVAVEEDQHSHLSPSARASTNSYGKSTTANTNVGNYMSFNNPHHHHQPTQQTTSGQQQRPQAPVSNQQKGYIPQQWTQSSQSQPQIQTFQQPIQQQSATHPQQQQHVPVGSHLSNRQGYQVVAGHQQQSQQLQNAVGQHQRGTSHQVQSTSSSHLRQPSSSTSSIQSPSTIHQAAPQVPTTKLNNGSRLNPSLSGSSVNTAQNASSAASSQTQVPKVCG
ncbi:hypothetical protein GYMLUDRAFT_785475 [Collybiopsis luxurians FD-317 M1]|nr:hypothetical protein GYMLUDRAFT_785475 [Collybiopsis luxurians FD-317 M1]